MNALIKIILPLFMLFFIGAVGQAADKKPNFVIILADDVGWDAFTCTNAPWARTPNIDQLAQQSVHMSRFYCSVSQCAPIRAEMYTGLLPNHNGVLANDKRVNRPGVKNVADHLRPLGYRVGWTGKKHFSLGDSQLDGIVGFPGDCNSSVAKYSLDGVRDYINQAQTAGEPFCVFICSIHAHHPWDLGDPSRFPIDKLKLPPHYVDTPEARNAIAKHAAEVELLDQQVGDTVNLLKSLKVDNDTVLIFLTEQGIAMPRGKWSPYDYGSRALCLAHWPGHIEPRKTNALAMYCDIVPTLIDLGGGKPVEGLDGTSMRKVLLEKADVHRESAFISNVDPFWQKAIVTADYKLIWTGDGRQDHIFNNFNSRDKYFSRPWAEWIEAAKNDAGAATKVERVLHPAEIELYKIDEDPYEINDLAQQPEMAATVSKLHNQLKDLMKASGESLEPESGGGDKKKK